MGVTGTHARDGLTVAHFFTTAGERPFDAVEWECGMTGSGTAKVSFEQEDVEFPTTWSQNATDIVAQKYFRGQLDSPARERSVKQMIRRVAGTIAGLGSERGYFASDDDRDAFEAELTHIPLHHMAAFNSPVWFNVGFEVSPQCSACRTWSRSSTGTPRRGRSSAVVPGRGSTCRRSVRMSGWSTSSMTILAARRVLPPDLIVPAPPVGAAYEADGTGRCAALRQRLHRGTRLHPVQGQGGGQGRGSA